MNSKLSKENLTRIKSCVIHTRNKTNCAKVTGMHVYTLDKILRKGYAKKQQLAKLLAYCDTVEGIKPETNE